MADPNLLNSDLKQNSVQAVPNQKLLTASKQNSVEESVTKSDITKKNEEVSDNPSINYLENSVFMSQGLHQMKANSQLHQQNQLSEKATLLQNKQSVKIVKESPDEN